MATRQRTRTAQHAAVDGVLLSVFLGDTPDGPCPYALPDGRTVDLANPFAVDLESLLHSQTASDAAEVAVLKLMRDTWPRLKGAALAEWKLRKRKGPPPGAVLERRAPR